MSVKFYKLSISIVLILLLNSCGADSEGSSDVSNGDRPNVIVIFTDDMGYADLGVQNQRVDVKTPNIDSIAMNGVKMTHGYVTAPTVYTI